MSVTYYKYNRLLDTVHNFILFFNRLLDKNPEYDTKIIVHGLIPSLLIPSAAKDYFIYIMLK